MIARIGLVLFGWSLAPFVVADDPKQADLAKKPQWQRMLTGEDAKAAEKLGERINQLESTDEYQEAIVAAKSLLALRHARQGTDHWETADVRHWVSQLEMIGARPSEERQRWRAAGIRGLQEARAFEAKGQFAKSIGFREKYSDACRLMLGDNHPRTGESYNNVAMILNRLGRPADALPLLRKALDVDRRSLGELHPSTAQGYGNLAFNLEDQGKIHEAEPLYANSLKIHLEVLGERHVHTATIYNNSAMNLQALGKVLEADRLLVKALDLTVALQGENHPATAGAYTNLASNMQLQGRVVEAEPLFRKGLSIIRHVLPAGHPDTATWCNNLASNLGKQGQFAESEKLFRESLAIRLAHYEDGHPSVATARNNLALSLVARGTFDEATPLLEKVLESYRKANADGQPATAKCYTNLGSIQFLQGRFAAAESMTGKSLEISRTALGDSHAFTLNCFNNYALSLLAGRKDAEAEAILLDAVKSYEASRVLASGGIERSVFGETNPRLLLAGVRANGKAVAAWTELELSLARGLQDERSSRTTVSLSPSEREALEAARARLTTTQQRVLDLVSVAARTPEQSQELTRLAAERRTLSDKVVAIGVADSERAVESLDGIRSALAGDAACLYWLDGPQNCEQVQLRFACVVRTGGEPKWERLPGTGPDKTWTKADTELARSFRTALAGNASAAEVASLAKQLHNQRIAPVLKHLDGVKKLHVVSVHDMAGIPIEAITSEFTVSYIPSGTFLVRARQKAKPSGNRMLALGDPVYETGVPKPAAKPLPSGGLLVMSVVPESVAANAKLKTGDVLLKYGDTELKDLDSLKAAIAANGTAKAVEIAVWRDGVAKPVEVAPGRLGVVLHQDPAPTAVLTQRKLDSHLAKHRGGDWLDLPGTRVETRRLHELFGDSAKLLVDDVASEQQLESLRKSGELAKYRYLHFATHGEGNSIRAFESALILSQDKLPKDVLPKAGEPFLNGQLSAREVLDFWKLDAELVTLSACETAIGKAGGGDGLLGFAQAFLTAGARSVCLSLWKVDDAATALLMGRFYENLLGNRGGLAKPMGKAAALDEAKRWLRDLTADQALELTATISNGVARGNRAKGDTLKLAPPAVDPKAKDAKPFAHPKYWAAFILIGDPN